MLATWKCSEKQKPDRVETGGVRETTSELERQQREVKADVSNRKPLQLPPKVNCHI